ncbi:MAG: energy transducer TonB [Terriglobales bacterium]|jgi:protein TonB|nr:energy transducer TonB [Terriglobales bacterium]
MRRVAIAIFASFVLATSGFSQDNTSAPAPPPAPASQESGTQAQPPSGRDAASVFNLCNPKNPPPCAQVWPRLLKDPSPKYSKKARRAHFQGNVALSLVVGTDGLPRDIRVQRSVGYGLDEEAVKAVRKWRFAPALMDGKAVAVNQDVFVEFHLD